MFEYTLEIDDEATTVPYDSLFDDVRSNHGFVDTRGRPGLASRIVECTRSSAMNDLLVCLAQPGSKMFSVGCDLGEKSANGDDPSCCVAGGYIQILNAKYSRYWLQEYEQYGESVAEMLESRSSGHEWRLDLVVTPVQFNLDNFRNLTGSIWVWFHAYGDSEEIAVRSREAYIVNLGPCLLDEKELAHFE